MGPKNWRKFAGGITDFIFTEDTPKPSDIIFIPGNGYPQMAEKAAALYQAGMAPKLLPSGRYYIHDGAFDGVKQNRERYSGNYATEWEFLSDVLTKNGVPEEALLMEDAATFTFENAIYSRRVTDLAGLFVRRGMVCCLAMHARRCRMYYELLYPEAEILIVSVPANGIAADNWMDTDEGIEAVLGEVERCGLQFEKILKSLKPGNTPDSGI